MRLLKSERALLALNERETEVFDLLNKPSPGLSMQQLVAQLGVPRTSLVWTLQQLERRGLVTAHTEGKKKLWTSCLEQSVLRSEGLASGGHSSELQLCRGVAEVKQLYHTVFAVQKHERITIVEGKRAAVAIVEKAGIDFVINWHNQALQSNLVIETIVSTETIRQIRKGSLSLKLVASLSRFQLWVGHVIPTELLDSNAALILFRDSVMLIDWQNETGVLVKNREIVSMIKHLVGGYKNVGEKINLIELLQGKI